MMEITACEKLAKQTHASSERGTREDREGGFGETKPPIEKRRERCAALRWLRKNSLLISLFSGNFGRPAGLVPPASSPGLTRRSVG
jgi:hypothetical protein